MVRPISADIIGSDNGHEPIQTPEAVIKDQLYKQLDYFGELVIRADDEDRIKYWNHFEKQHSLFKDKNVKFGRVYNRRKLCRLAAILTAAMLKMDGEDVNLYIDKKQQKQDDEDDIGGGKNVSESILNVSITKWKNDHWDCFKKLLYSAANGLIRKDTNANISEGEDEELNEVQASATIYTSRLETVVKTIQVLRGVSPFRESMMTVLSDSCDYDDDESLPIDEDVMKQYWKAAREETNEDVKNVLLGIIQKQGPSGNLHLIPVGMLRGQLRQKPLCLGHFYTRVNRLLRSWADNAFGEDTRDGDDDEDNDVNDDNHGPSEPRRHRRFQGEIERLRKKRSRLMHHGIDPLEESYNLANNVATVTDNNRGKRRLSSSSRHNSTPNQKKKKGNLLDKKKSAVRLEFEDDVEDDDSSRDEVGLVGTPRLSRLPSPGRFSTPDKRKPSRFSQRKKYDGRRIWSDEEKLAIKKGIQKFGWGQWANIKREFYTILEDRTSGQIKDCVRTMRKRGELHGIDESESRDEDNDE